MQDYVGPFKGLYEAKFSDKKTKHINCVLKKTKKTGETIKNYEKNNEIQGNQIHIKIYEQLIKTCKKQQQCWCMRISLLCFGP